MSDAPRLSAAARSALFAMPAVLLVVGSVVAVLATSRLPNDPAGPYGGYLARYNPHPEAGGEPDGEALYAQNCAHCHGVNGDGNGVAPLSPKARHFGFERFKFTDTLNPAKGGGGTPTDDTLLAVLRRGIPGSPMPAFATLGEANLRAIVGHVRGRFLRPDVVLARIKQAEMKKAGDDWEEKSDWSWAKQAKYRTAAAAEIEVGTPLEVPTPFPEPSDDSVRRGQKAFEMLGCSKCHGPEGRGDGEQVKDPKFVNENGTRAYPRDLTAGVYKGGGESADLYRRVFLGIPGTPMPANGATAARQDLIDVVHFVKTLPSGKPAQPTAGKKVALR